MAEFGYPRRLRLLTGNEFKRVFDRADLKISDNNLLILARRSQSDHSRIGFVISKKNVRRAVNRNRVRRIIRESFRLNQHNLPPYDLVVLARKGIGEVETEAIQRLISKSWNRLNKKADKAKSA